MPQPTYHLLLSCLFAGGWFLQRAVACTFYGFSAAQRTAWFCQLFGNLEGVSSLGITWHECTPFLLSCLPPTLQAIKSLAAVSRIWSFPVISACFLVLKKSEETVVGHLEVNSLFKSTGSSCSEEHLLLICGVDVLMCLCMKGRFGNELSVSRLKNKPQA